MSLLVRFLKLFIISFLLFISVIVVVFFLHPEQPAKETEFGVTFSKQQAEGFDLDWKEAYADMLDDLGVRRLRLSAYWTDIEPEGGEYDFEILDWQIAQAKKRDVKILLAIGRKLPRWPECHIPEWAGGLGEKEQNEAVLDMLETVVTRYKDERAIWAWQVENEPLFPFGICPEKDMDFFEKEVVFVRNIDSTRPIITTDSGEMSLWLMAGSQADIFGTTLYKIVPWKIVGFISYDFLPTVYYRKKAAWLKRLLPNLQDIIVVELQAEPYTGGVPVNLDTLERLFGRFDLERFKKHIQYSRDMGYSQTYLWGVEWWYWLKEEANHPEFWDEAKRLF